MYPKADFEAARQLYPGRKRGADTEYDYYVNRVLKKHRLKEATITPLLSPAIQRQIQERQKQGFHPHWKDFKSWLLNRYWELGEDGKKKERVCFGCGGAWSSTVYHPEIKKDVPVCWPCKQRIRGY